MLLLLSLLGCTPAIPDDAAVLDLDPSDVLHSTGRLIGWNLGDGTRYAPEDTSRHPEWRTPETQQAIETLASIRATDQTPWLRFAGVEIDGIDGEDGYHFRTWVDPDLMPAPGDPMGTFHAMALVHELGGEPSLTLNHGSGTAEEAAAYARHVNGTDASDPDVASRMIWGDFHPYEVTAFELGSEVYAPWNTGASDEGPHAYADATLGDPEWAGRPSSDPEAYAARALTYVEAVLAVTPEARFTVPLSQADFSAWGGPETSVPALSSLLSHPAVAAVAIHHDQVDAALAVGGWQANSPEIALAGSAFLEPGYQELFEALATVNREDPLQVHITEYGYAGARAPESFNVGKTAANGLATADMLTSFSEWGVDRAVQRTSLSWSHTWTDPNARDWYLPLRWGSDGELRETPAIQVTRLFAQAMRENTLRQHWTNLNQLRGGDGSDSAPLFLYDEVGVAAFADAQGNQIGLFFLNRDLEQPTWVRIRLEGEWAYEDSTSWLPFSWDQPNRAWVENPIEPSEGAIETYPDLRTDFLHVVLFPGEVAVQLLPGSASFLAIERQ